MNVSVVIPLYNKALYIGRAIESVLNQSVQSDEIVIIDDGSTDNSVSEVLKFKDSRIRLIQQPNAGEGATRNNGVAEAQYGLVAFLDADDQWKPDFLLNIKRLRNNFPDCGAYGTAYEIIDPGGSSSHPVLKGVPPAPWIGIIPNIFKMLEYDSPFCSSSIAIPKNVYWELKGFSEGVTQGADKMMWIRLGSKYPIAFSPSRQAIYHREAINRACNIFEPTPAAANLIDRMITNGEIPISLLDDARNYYAALKLQKARLMVIQGHAESARGLLDSIKRNRKYRSQALWWYFWSIMPHSIFKSIQSLRSRSI
jgi:glycosyltransferase involved in cell wall biosynthesis